MPKLPTLASQVRSKNAGPLRLTFDIFFDNKKSYAKVRDSGKLKKESVARLYGIPEDHVLGVYELDHLQVIKISIKRSIVAGDVRDSDMYGTQQHVPLLEVEIE